MSDSPAGRDFIVDFLREELVGPSAAARGYPAVQIDRQEILRDIDAPKTRYAAGILFPTSAESLSQEETAADESPTDEAEPTDEDDLSESPDRSEFTEVNIDPNENPDDTDPEVTLANRLLPSAMGLSALVEVRRCLRVDVSAGIYEREELEWGERRKNEDGTESYRKAWWRRPVDRYVILSASELLHDVTVAFEKTVLKDGRADALVLHVVSRPYPAVRASESESARHLHACQPPTPRHSTAQPGLLLPVWVHRQRPRRRGLFPSLSGGAAYIERRGGVVAATPLLPSTDLRRRTRMRGGLGRSGG